MGVMELVLLRPQADGMVFQKLTHMLGGLHVSHVKVVTLHEVGDVSIVYKTKRDISVETPLD